MNFLTWLENKKQQQTDAFRAWFGNSKVVDAEGNPLVVYTGTSKDKEFNSFRPGKGGLIWFTSDPKGASSYAMDNDSMGFKRDRWELTRTNTASRVMPVYLKIENPYIDTEPPTHSDYKDQRQYIWSKMSGHDGYIDVKYGIYVVTSAYQIKSASGNRGMFNPDKKSIVG